MPALTPQQILDVVRRAEREHRNRESDRIVTATAFRTAEARKRWEQEHPSPGPRDAFVLAALTHAIGRNELLTGGGE